MKTILLNPIIVGIVIVLTLASDVESTSSVFLTADADGGIPKNNPTDKFNCRQKIYIVFEETGLKNGRHTLEGFWINPNGKQQEYTKYDFEASKEKESIWLWLELHTDGGKLFGAITPSYGVDIFSGRWTVRLYLDGKLLEEKVFYVIC